MGLIEKVDHDDLIIYEIIRNPVLFTEFIHNFDKLPGEERFELTWYQKDMLLDFNNYVSIVAGRSVGKTLSMVGLILWAMIFRPFNQDMDYLVYIVPSRANLDPVWSGLVRMYRTNSFLKQFIYPNSGINASDFKISLLNSSVLLCRLAGQTGGGISVIGLHTPLFIVDESGYFPWGTWLELLPTLNSFTQGFRLLVAGVPDGRREKSVCYHADQVNNTFSRHRISALQNPRFTEEDHRKAKENYGGETSEDYKHFVLGIHGVQVFALFDRSIMLIENNPVYKLKLDGVKLGKILTEYINRLTLLPSIDRKETCVIGIDLGYTEPTAILILKLDQYGRFHFHARVELNKVDYNLQERIFDYIDTRYNPLYLAVDRGSGGQGISVIHHLQNELEYADKNYEQRLIPIEFSSNIIIGIDENGEEITSKTKPMSVSILQEYTNNHKIVFSSTDLEMVTELERMTYTKNPSGEIVYRTLTERGGLSGADHNTTALLCAVLAYWLQNEFLQKRLKRKKLAKPRWLGGR